MALEHPLEVVVQALGCLPVDVELDRDEGVVDLEVAAVLEVGYFDLMFKMFQMKVRSSMVKPQLRWSFLDGDILVK